MKLDKIRFARVVTLIATRLNINHINDEFVADLDKLIDVELPQPEHKTYVAPALIDNLLEAISEGRRLDAMRVHRALTGSTLKEACRVIDAHCKASSASVPKTNGLYDRVGNITTGPSGDIINAN